MEWIKPSDDNGIRLPSEEERSAIIAEDRQIIHCDIPMEVVRTKTRRTHTCKKCGSWWRVDVSGLIPSMFGMDIIVSQQPTIPSTDLKVEEGDV